MPSDPEKSRVIEELSQAAEEAARVDRALAETHGVFTPGVERRQRDRRAVDDRRIADRRAAARPDA